MRGLRTAAVLGSCALALAAAGPGRGFHELVPGRRRDAHGRSGDGALAAERRAGRERRSGRRNDRASLGGARERRGDGGNAALRGRERRGHDAAGGLHAPSPRQQERARCDGRDTPRSRSRCERHHHHHHRGHCSHARGRFGQRQRGAIASRPRRKCERGGIHGRADGSHVRRGLRPRRGHRNAHRGGRGRRRYDAGGERARAEPGDR